SGAHRILICNHDRTRTLSSETATKRPADAGGPTRYDRNFTVQLHGKELPPDTFSALVWPPPRGALRRAHPPAAASVRPPRPEPGRSRHTHQRHHAPVSHGQ